MMEASERSGKKGGISDKSGTLEGEREDDTTVGATLGVAATGDWFVTDTFCTSAGAIADTFCTGAVVTLGVSADFQGDDVDTDGASGVAR